MRNILITLGLVFTQLYSKLQLVRAEICDIIDEHVTTRQELEQTLNELTREMKFKYFLHSSYHKRTHPTKTYSYVLHTHMYIDILTQSENLF